jgi:malate dehydrogenase (oxaloacetate-decarboxylating)(NADP+)
MICGLVGRYHKKLGYLRSVIDLDPGVQSTSAMTGVINERGVWFFLDTHVQLDPSARKMRRVRELLKARVPKLEVDGEMMADTAWDEDLRYRIFPNTTLKGRANLYVLPNLDAANITYNMVRVMTDGVALGPILMGIDQPAHILTPASSPRRVVNMTAIAAVEAQIRKAQRAQ